MTSVAFSPDGQLVATASSEGNAWVWEVVSGREYTHIPPDDSERALTKTVRGVAFSPDGRLRATAGPGWSARIWAG